MRVIVENTSPEPRLGWVPVSLPRTRAAALPERCTLDLGGGRSMLAARGASRGIKTLYHIYGELQGRETVAGDLLPAGELSVQFEPHVWVTDKLEDRTPGFTLMLHDDSLVRSEVRDARLVEEGKVYQRWRLRSWAPSVGVFMETWVTVYTGDPVPRYHSKIVWSDRNDPSPVRMFKQIAVDSPEFMTLDFDVAHGATAVYQRSDGRWERHLLDAPLTLQDGAGLPMSGQILCFVDEPASFNDPQSHSEVNRSAAQLRSAARGELLAVCADWNGAYLGSGYVPRFHEDPPTIDPRREVIGEMAQFESSLQFRRGWLAARPLGLDENPAKTGADDDFGAGKGSGAVSLHIPRYLRMMRYSAYSHLFRGKTLYEADGSILRAHAHQDWVTWSLSTHWHAGVSRDRLGKDPNPAGIGTGWDAEDDEHRSQLTEAAYALLSDDPMMENLFDHQAELDLAAYRVVYPGMGAGPTRAQGRSIQTLSQLASVVDWRVAWKILQAMNVRQEAMLQFVASQAGPMVVMSHGAPDPRKQVYLAGQLAPWTSMWELGLALVGIYGNYLKALAEPGASQQGLLWAFESLCETLATYGVVEHAGTTFLVADVRYDGGEHVEIVPELRNGEWHAEGDAAVLTHLTDGVTEWVFAGLLVAREVLGERSNHRDKLDRAVAEITGGVEAQDRITAEWWAAVRSV